ncbi:GNAT family N-acetyltransferase [Dyella ginsengisoli]|uniref:GNAT family N-acetyltransferase n=1 Tax=Dyella ginsengisoli TaxID=363848 RepID=UPI00034B3816|nr:GNAT family N-acetyltransferase [Dyella ginsengisoli]
MSGAIAWRTARLSCRLARPDDAEALWRYRTANREHLAPWEPLRDEAYYTSAHSRRTLEEWMLGVAQDRAYPILMFDPDEREMLGSFTFSNVVRGPFQACLLGYGLAAGLQGRGLMREALTPALDWAFGTLGLHRVMANYLPRNERSGRLLAALGFEREGLARRYLQIAGVWEDHVLTAKLAPD